MFGSESQYYDYQSEEENIDEQVREVVFERSYDSFLDGEVHGNYEFYQERQNEPVKSKHSPVVDFPEHVNDIVIVVIQVAFQLYL